MSANEFSDALETHSPGQIIVYAIGFIAIAKHEGRWQGVSRELELLTDMVLTAAARRHVCLTQRRIQENTYEYRATVCSRQVRAA